MVAKDFHYNVTDLSANLQGYALNLTKDYQDARDLMQETVYRALKNGDKFSEGTNLKGWLVTIMRNIFINSFHRKARYKAVLEDKISLHGLPISHTVDNSAEASFVMGDVMNSINELGDIYKVPFLMYYNGYKYQEIAETLHLPVGTIKSRVFYARQKLRGKLASYR